MRDATAERRRAEEHQRLVVEAAALEREAQRRALAILPDAAAYDVEVALALVACRCERDVLEAGQDGGEGARLDGGAAHALDDTRGAVAVEERVEEKADGRVCVVVVIVVCGGVSDAEGVVGVAVVAVRDC